MAMAKNVGDQAVVLGAGIAGLLAARVLAEAYQRVTVVDRDALIGVTEPRRAVPQGPHIHGLLARGQQILEELFPGFTKELAASGVPIGDFGTCLSWYFNGRMMQPAKTGLVCVSPGRPLLEERIRERVRALTNVQILELSDVVGLTADRGRITGVRVHGHGVGGPERVLKADLVVDAAGRGSRTPRWLSELGYPAVAQDAVKIDLTYTTADFRLPLPVDPVGDDVGIVCVATPDHPRGATLARLPDRYSLSLYGILGDVPPTDRDGFLAFARSLPVPEIIAAVEHARPLTDPVSMHFPASVRHRYERMERLPDGLLVIGDAACIFNPIYAQGMTVAAIEALVLSRHLQQSDRPRPRAYFRDLARVIDPPWDMCAGGDLGFPEVAGHRTLKVRMGNAYIPRLQKAAVSNAALSEAFLRAAGLVDPPQALMRPAVVSRVLRPAKRRQPASARLAA
jgi:2-polyprenyl-6-methoxyphenol hydroxylase-like FAD-dependent oxidoreductase